MKKVCFYALFSLLAIAVAPSSGTAQSQSTRTAAEEFVRDIFSRKQQGEDVVVSRKKTENKEKTEAENAPRREEPVSTREGKTPSRKSGGYQNRKESRKTGTYGEQQNRREQGRYEGQRRERQESGDKYEAREKDNYGKGRGSARKGQYGARNSKSKCGVRGCHHPGKHKGLHKN